MKLSTTLLLGTTLGAALLGGCATTPAASTRVARATDCSSVAAVNSGDPDVARGNRRPTGGLPLVAAGSSAGGRSAAGPIEQPPVVAAASRAGARGEPAGCRVDRTYALR